MGEDYAATNFERVADRYIALWNEPDADARSRAVAGLWIEDGAYTDPLTLVRGHRAIEEVVSGVREQFPGHVFELVGIVDAHHDVARFGWELAPESVDESMVVGFDVAVVADDGRLRNVYGFLDKVPGS